MTTRLGPREEFRALKRFVTELENRFLARHLVSTTLGPQTREDALDVAAYVVLTHGAFENFVEGLGLWILEKLERTWLYKKRATRSAASVLLYQAAPEGEMAPGVTVFDNLRVALEQGKTAAATKIAKNHGISPAHLRDLFRPLGVDVPEDITLTASLDSLVALRHQWAHQYRFGARVLKSAREVKKTVTDCLDLAERLSAQAAAARP